MFFAPAADAQEKVYRIETDGELTPKQRGAIAELLAPGTGDTVARASDTKNLGWMGEVCFSVANCRKVDGQLTKGFVVEDTLSDRRFLGVEPDSATAKILGAAYHLPPPRPPIVSLNPDGVSDNLIALSFSSNLAAYQALENKSLAGAFSEIDREIDLTAQLRTFAALRPEQVTALNSVGFRTTEESDDEEAGDFVHMLNDSTPPLGSCTPAPPADWPWNASRLVEQVNFNTLILGDAGFDPVAERSRILVLDNGIGKTLATLKRFRRRLYPYFGVSFRPVGYFNDNSLQHQNCSNSTSRLQTITPLGVSVVPPFLSKNSCGEKSDIYAPAAGTTVSYEENHGSIVASAAAGSHHVLENHDCFRQLVGVTAAKVFQPHGTKAISSYSTVLEALEWALAPSHIVGKTRLRSDVDIVNISLKFARKGDVVDSRLTAAKNSIRSGSVLVVAAAGNDTSHVSVNENIFPMVLVDSKDSDLHDRIIIVGALNPSGAAASFSNRGSVVDVWAPGVNIPTWDNEGATVCASGTSIAAPNVSFIAGLIHSFGIRTPSEIKGRIIATAKEIGVKGEKALALDPYLALDIFVDLLWDKDDGVVRRGEILPSDPTEPDDLTFEACKDSETGSIVDADIRNVTYWKNVGSSGIDLKEIGSVLLKCGSGDDILNKEIKFLDFETGKESDIPLKDISRLVPTRFRGALKNAKKISDTQADTTAPQFCRLE